MQDNAVPLQQHPEYYLCVPGSGPTSLLATASIERADQEDRAEIFIAGLEEPKNGPLPDDAVPVHGVQPMKVFSPSLFTGMVCQVFFSINSKVVLTLLCQDQSCVRGAGDNAIPAALSVQTAFLNLCKSPW